MKKIWKAVMCIGILALLGYCIYEELPGKQSSYNIVLMIIAVFVFTYLIYIFADSFKWQYIMLSLLIGCIVTNIFIYIPTSYTPLNYKEQNWKIETTSEWFLPDKTQEVDIQARYYRLFEETVLYNLLKDKTVIFQDILTNDFRAATIVELGSRREYAGISSAGSERYIQQYNPQVITLEYKQAETKKICLVTGTVWERPESIIHVVLDEENNIWMIPDSLLEAEYKAETAFKYEHDTNLSEMEKVTYAYRYDSVTEKLFTQDMSNMYCNILYLLFLGICGYLFLLPFKCRVERAVLVYLSVPFGALLEIASCIFMYCILGIKVNIISLVAGMVIPTFIIWVGTYKKRKNGNINEQMKEKFSLETYVSIGIVLFSIVGASIWHRAFLSPDSIRGISLANRAVQGGDMRSYFAGISDYALFMPIINIGAIFFKVRIFYAFIPVLVCSFMGMGWTVMKWQLTNVSATLRNFIFVCCFGAVITVPVFQLGAFWILNNLGIGLFYFGAVLLLLESKQKEHCYFKYLALPLFIFANIARVEGPVFGAIFVLLLDEMDEEAGKTYSIVLSIVTMIIFGINFAFNRSGEVFWSISKGAILVLATWFVMAYVLWIKKWNFTEIIVRKINMGVLISCSLACGIGLVSVFKTDLALNNIKAFSESLLVNGTHGILWIIYLFTFLLDGSLKDDKMQAIKFIRNIINTYFLTIFALMLFRINPLYSGYNGFKDSANRMMLHVMPMLVLYFIYVIKQLSNEDKNNTLLKKGV